MRSRSMSTTSSVGSGLKRGGLNVMIAFDLSVQGSGHYRTLLLAALAYLVVRGTGDESADPERFALGDGVGHERYW